MNLLEVKNCTVHFRSSTGLLSRNSEPFRAVDGVSFAINSGESLGLVGESGCGKTTLSRAILQLIQMTEGEIRFKGRALSEVSSHELTEIRRRLQIIFQDPYSALDPRLRIRSILSEPLDIHGLLKGKTERRVRLEALLTQVGLPLQALDRYPHEFSGGQRQRIVIARALALEPEFIICDEPVSALDVSVQAQIMNLLADLQQRFQLACLFISHDLILVGQFCRRIMVMYRGKIVESASSEDILSSPLHPYTRMLISSVPVLGGVPLKALSRSTIPDEIPELREVHPGHWVAIE